MIPLLLIGAAYLIGKTMEGESYYNGGKVKLLAPNGLPSKLTPKQYKLVRTPEFKAWFGDWENDADNASKVIDEETKEPLVCYHGTPNKITKNIFDKKKVGYNTYNALRGFYFTDNISVAKSYTYDDNEEKYLGSIIEVFLNVKNIAIIDAEKMSWFYLSEKINIDENIKFFLESGYNGVMVKNIKDPFIYDENGADYLGNNFIVDESNQIKLADGSNTTFDGKNPDIRYDEGGIIEPTERTEWNGYKVGDVIDGGKLDELSGGLVGNNPKKKFILVQARLSKFKENRKELLYENKGYEEEEIERLELMKRNFEKTPPIPNEGDGMHRIIAAKELGHKTILMWQDLSKIKSLEELDYNLRYPKENKLLFLDADKLLKRHSIDNPSFDITKKENQIGNRVQKAKDYISDYLLDNRWINRKTNERTNTKVTFEPSIAGIYNGKLGFEDGRHRILAAKELGFKKVAVEVPKEQVSEFEKYFK